MHPKRKQRLILVSFLTLGFAGVVGLVLFSLGENMNHFYNPSQVAAGEAPKGVGIRAGGMVREGSVSRDPNSLKVSFVLTDYEADMQVEFDGILPDLFREGQGIVSLGKINQAGVFVAEEVLAKHDENYMPPEVAEALAKAGKGPLSESFGQEAYSKDAYRKDGDSDESDAP